MGSCEVPVMITSKEVVAPRNPIEKHRLPLTNLDLVFPQGMNVGAYLCYKKPPLISVENMVRILRESLSDTLSAFYIFAGEIVENSRGEPESLCNNRGVDFVHACAVSELKDIDFYHPDFSIQGKFVPYLKKGVFSVQVTELRCGGLVVGCIFDHRVADAYSANMFLRSWAENAQQKPTFYSPNSAHFLLKPRIPPHYPKSIDKWYTTVSPKSSNNNDLHHLEPEEYNFTSRTFYIEAQQISNLQQQACSNGRRRTKYEAFTSFLWKTLAYSMEDDNKQFKMSIAIDGRTRLFEDSTKETDALTRNYFGNVVSFPFIEVKAKDLKEMTLSESGDLIHECKEETTKSEHFYGIIDWVEIHRPKQPATRIVHDKHEEDAGVLVSSGLRFPVFEMDFGWGKPTLGAYYNPWGGQGGYVMPLPSAKGNGDWIVFMHLRTKQMDVMEKIAGHVLKPLLPSYLNLE